jgi:tripartite-type tricarboxylate transporter receptor subunit TctC
MPQAHIHRVAAVLADVVRRPEMRQKLFNQGWQVAGTSPEGLFKRMQTDTAQMAEVIRTQGVKAQ